MRPARSEIRRCRHCRAEYLIASPADRRGRRIAVYVTPDPLLGALAITRDAFSVWRWRQIEPGEIVVPPETLHIEHPTPCPKAPQDDAPQPARRPETAARLAPPPGVISLDQARLRRARRQQRRP